MEAKIMKKSMRWFFTITLIIVGLLTVETYGYGQTPEVIRIELLQKERKFVFSDNPKKYIKIDETMKRVLSRFDYVKDDIGVEFSIYSYQLKEYPISILPALYKKDNYPGFLYFHFDLDKKIEVRMLGHVFNAQTGIEYVKKILLKEECSPERDLCCGTVVIDCSCGRSCWSQFIFENSKLTALDIDIQDLRAYKF
jgi:hypothetical protein